MIKEVQIKKKIKQLVKKTKDWTFEQALYYTYQSAIADQLKDDIKSLEQDLKHGR